jgi:hypothetical protein
VARKKIMKPVEIDLEDDEDFFAKLAESEEEEYAPPNTMNGVIVKKCRPKVAKKSVEDVIETAGNELTPCPCCQGSATKRFKSAQRYRIKIQTYAVYPDGSERSLALSETVIQGDLTLDEQSDLCTPNMPPTAEVIPTTEW